MNPNNDKLSGDRADNNKTPVAFITGAARRIGSCTAELFHQQGFNIALHYNHSRSEADRLCERLNSLRPNSAIMLRCDLSEVTKFAKLADTVENFGPLKVLINNASSFFPTDFLTSNEQQWDNLIDSNLKGPYFLSRALAPQLTKNHGAIVNIADIHADQPLHKHSIYCIAKAGNVMMSKTLAKELAPSVRVNAVAPGAIMWPEGFGELSEEAKESIVAKIPLQRTGKPDDIANAIYFLACSAQYVTGQTIAVDGGRSHTL